MHGAAHWRLSQYKHEDKDLACKQTPDAVHSDRQTTAKNKASVHWQLRTHKRTHIYISSTPCENSIPLTLCWLEVAVYSFSGRQRLLWDQGLCAMNSASVIVWKDDCADFIRRKVGTTDCIQAGREGQKHKDRLFTTFWAMLYLDPLRRSSSALLNGSFWGGE